MESFDILVIGGGPAGYVGAIRAAQLGFKTACVDAFTRHDQPSLGGTCLNVGCIPSKALLDTSEKFESAQHDWQEHGIHTENMSIDIAQMMKRKDGVIDKLTSGIAYLFKKNKVTSYHGYGKLLRKESDGWIVSVGDTEVKAKHILIATGSRPRELPSAPFSGNIVDNSGALQFDQVPERLGMIGAGVIGLELGSVWRRLGSKVTILEAMPQFLATADAAISREALKQFKGQGLDFHFGITINEITDENNKVSVSYTEGEKTHTEVFDKLIVCIGRVPNTEGLGASEVGLQINDRGFIVVNEHYQTNLEGIYAVGDVIGGAMLAHKAEEEAIAAIELMAGQAGHVNYDVIPWVMYTNPEIAWVGLTEAQAKEKGLAIKTGQFPFSANGRALGHGHSSGFIKVIADANTDKVLGVHMIGGHVSELIAEAVTLMEFGGSAEDLGRTIHAHPTLSEVLKEAALAVNKTAIHM